MDVRPAPTDEEAAAIVAALELVRPRPVADEPEGGVPAWRFSGRWWARPIVARRRRPW